MFAKTLILFLNLSFLLLTACQEQPSSHKTPKKPQIQSLSNSAVDQQADNSFFLAKEGEDPLPADPKSMTLAEIIRTVKCEESRHIILSYDDRFLLTTPLYSTGSYQIIDISNKAAPRVVSEIPKTTRFPEVLALSSSNPQLFYFCDGSKLQIVNVSDFSSPVVLGSFKIPESYWGAQSFLVSADGKTAYLGTSTLETFDVSDPKNISKLQILNSVPANSLHLMKDGITLLAGGSETLSLLDVSKPDSPVVLSSISVDGQASSIVVSANQKDVYVASIFREDHTKSRIIISHYEIVNKKTLIFKRQIYSPPAGSFNSPKLSLSASEAYIYVTGFKALLAIHLQTREEYFILEDSMFEPDNFAMSADGRYGYVILKGQLTVMRLFLDLHLNRILSPSPSFISEMELGGDLPVISRVSPDEKTLFVMVEKDRDFGNYIEVFDISDKTAPTKIKVLKESSFKDFQLSKDGQWIFLRYERKIEIIRRSDFTTQATIPSLRKDSNEYEYDEITHIMISPNGTRLFIFEGQNFNENHFLSIFDISTPSEPKNLSTIQIEGFSRGNLRPIFSSNFEIVYFFGSYDDGLSIMNFTDPTSPIKMGTILQEYIFSSFNLSPDGKTIFVICVERDIWSFHIVDVSDPHSPKTLSMLYLPIPGNSVKSILSPDGNTAFITTKNGLITIDVGLPTSPTITSVIYKDNNVRSLSILNDGRTFLIGLGNSTIRVVDVTAQTAGFLTKKRYALGGLYSSSLQVLKAKANYRYDAFPQSYVFIRMSVYKAIVLPANAAVKETLSALPTWITFDKENKVLTFEPKSQTCLGSYNLRGVVSTAVPKEAFVNLPKIPTRKESVELLVHLVGLGYVDTEGFLTSKFYVNTPLLLNPYYEDIETNIRKVLSKHYFEFSNAITIESSLVFSTAKPLKIETLFPNSVSVHLVLKDDQNYSTPNAQFVSQTYPGILTTITHQKTHITLDGYLDEINSALGSLLINLNKSDSYCNASITISDGSNPVITETIHKISDSLPINKSPKENPNVTIQSQVNESPIKTGEHFQIELSASSFLDTNPDRLQFSIRMPNPHTPIPTWISLKGLILSGIAPEKIMFSEVKLIFVAKNEFKEVEVPFSIDIKLSFIFILQTLAKYGSYIFSAIGLYVLVTKIYNIIGLKFYRHPKTFLLFAGQEVSSSCIYPISFVAEEIKISTLIQRKLRADVAEALGKKIISDQEFIDYFRNNEDKSLDKAKIVRVIKNVISNLDFITNQKIKPYATRVNLYKDLICELIFCDIVMKALYLPHEKRTKAVFKSIRNDWNDLVEFNKSSKFLLREKKFESRVNMAVSNASGQRRDSENEPLIQNLDFNIDLLKQAIVVYAFQWHNLNFRIYDIDINVKEQTFSDSSLLTIIRLLKSDHEMVPSNDKGKVGYGIRYEIKQNTLSFVGVPEEDFAGRTVIIQIVTKKGRIIRELCIMGYERDLPVIEKVEECL